MTINDALLFTYDAAGGGIQGKTNLQKRMFFVAVMLGEDFGYGAHYYGPYSATVAAANQELKSLGYLSESTASAGSYNASGFEIAGEDHHFKPATATVDGQSILVTNSQVETPRYVRYGWTSAPVLNVYNSAGLPASPFTSEPIMPLP